MITNLPVKTAPIDHAGHPDYLERVYAGVLGKIIGVYLGRPVENWSYERIQEEFGEISYYVHEQRGRRLIITDDDISGTFTFLRALEDYGYDPNLTSEQIGQTWLNYLIEKTTILWWGGMGNSTEHTAYLRLKSGIRAPRSGSAELNSQIVAEQIGAQIFIDGWGLSCPGDGARAAEFAKRAAQVSHDGEAVYAAQVVASLVANAFTESDINRLLDKSLALIPEDCTIARLIHDLRTWHATGEDWRATRERLKANYGYDKYQGNCHMVPNHGLIILSLLHGEGDFDRSMMVVNTCGWDTDCNAGNVGAILGVRNGLAAFERQDWRGPVADRLYIPSADGGRSITDALAESVIVANGGRALAGLTPLAPKNGARFHFSLPGSVQGWCAQEPHGSAFWKDGELVVENLDPRQCAIHAATPTFIPPDTKDMVTGYVLVANPTLFEGHRVTANLSGKATGRLFIAHYGPEDESIRVYGDPWHIDGGSQAIEWTIPSTDGYPIHEMGIELQSGSVSVDTVDWQGVPETSWPPLTGTMWPRAWADSLSRFEFQRDSYEFLTQNEGIGMLTQGSRKWRDYQVDVRLTPRMAASAGIAVRVQGLRRYYAFLFGEPGEILIVKELDGRSVLATASFDWQPFTNYELSVQVLADKITVSIDGKVVLQAQDDDLQEGAFGFIVEEGCLGAGTPRIRPR